MLSERQILILVTYMHKSRLISKKQRIELWSSEPGKGAELGEGCRRDGERMGNRYRVQFYKRNKF
jgi:hypothetical protein